MTGTTWNVDAIFDVTDGDTLRVYRSTTLRLGDDWFTIADAQPDGRPRNVPVRLAWVDTPERGKPGWRDARKDLEDFLSMGGPFRVVVFESAGWDRVLVDLVNADGNSASQWLMTPAEDGGPGWPPYVKA